MSEVPREPRIPPMETPLYDPTTGKMNRAWYRYFEGERGYINNVNSGAAILADQQAAQELALAQERAARIVNDAAVQASASGGSGSTSNGAAFSAGVSSGATWVPICTVPLTPTGAGGDYSITVYADELISGSLSDESAAGATFNGNWRIREELTGGGTEYTLDSGTFSVTYTAPQSLIEAGIPFDIPATWVVSFTGLPLTAVLIAANEGAAVDVRLEIQRASGTNEITALGLSGSMSIVWTA